jgi:hypothetical protein
MASDEFGHAAKQETLDPSLSMRTNNDRYAVLSQFARPAHGLTFSDLPTREHELPPFAGEPAQSATTHAKPGPLYAQSETA